MVNPVTGPITKMELNLRHSGVHIGVNLDTHGVTYWSPGPKPLDDSPRWSDLSKPTVAIGRIKDGEVFIGEGATLEDG